MVELLLRNDAEITATTEHGRTALHLACIRHFPIICCLLMARGADPRLINGFGHTSIDWAIADPLTLSSLEIASELAPEDIFRRKQPFCPLFRKI
jgi:hypothetical protein